MASQLKVGAVSLVVGNLTQVTPTLAESRAPVVGGTCSALSSSCPKKEKADPGLASCVCRDCPGDSS